MKLWRVVKLDFKFYITHAVNYSSKSVILAFGFTNKKGQQKESMPLFVPKKAIVELDLKNKTVTLQGWYYHNYGYLYRYRTDKAPSPPKTTAENWDEFLWTFDPQHETNLERPFPSLEGIEVIN